MASLADPNTIVGEAQLRERKPHIEPTAESAQEKVMRMNKEEAERKCDDKARKTFGRTPDGTSMRCLLSL